MECKDRIGNIVFSDGGQDRFLELLYGNPIGRGIVKLITRPAVSKLGGFLLSTSISKYGINSFVEKNNIDMEQFEDRKFQSYNDFFTRKIKEGKRTVDKEQAHLIAPCDSRLTVYDISSDGVIGIKGGKYTVASLLRSEKLAEEFNGGILLKFRLCVDDYHRYCYVDNGRKSKNRTIGGVFHTVNPAAEKRYAIYKENVREYCQIQTENFGKIIQMEVGAMMVGKIVNYHEACMVTRGEEKGYFEFGGSTIIVLLKKDKAVIDSDILKNSIDGYETKVLYGEKIGIKY